MVSFFFGGGGFCIDHWPGMFVGGKKSFPIGFFPFGDRVRFVLLCPNNGIKCGKIAQRSVES